MQETVGPARMNPEAPVPLAARRLSTPAAIAAVVLGVLSIAAAARIEVPIRPVPMTLQTCAVLVVGAVLGRRIGLAVVMCYLGAAAAGMPVLAGGASGIDRLIGPTGGYLAGFALAAAVVGRLAECGLTRRIPSCLAVMLAGHAIILGLGTARLAALMPAGEALEKGVEPFVLGALVKSALATATVAAAESWRRRGREPSDPA